jgi:hypothetical protein
MMYHKDPVTSPTHKSETKVLIRDPSQSERPQQIESRWRPMVVQRCEDTQEQERARRGTPGKVLFPAAVSFLVHKWLVSIQS